MSFSGVGVIKVADRDLAGLMKHVEDGRRRYSWRGNRVDGLRQDSTQDPTGAESEEQVLDGRLDAAVHETSGWRDARGARRGRRQRHVAAAGTPRRRLRQNYTLDLRQPLPVPVPSDHHGVQPSGHGRYQGIAGTHASFENPLDGDIHIFHRDPIHNSYV